MKSSLLSSLLSIVGVLYLISYVCLPYISAYLSQSITQNIYSELYTRTDFYFYYVNSTISLCSLFLLVLFLLIGQYRIALWSSFILQIISMAISVYITVMISPLFYEKRKNYVFSRFLNISSETRDDWQNYRFCSGLTTSPPCGDPANGITCCDGFLLKSLDYRYAYPYSYMRIIVPLYIISSILLFLLYRSFKNSTIAELNEEN